ANRKESRRSGRSGRTTITDCDADQNPFALNLIPLPLRGRGIDQARRRATGFGDTSRGGLCETSGMDSLSRAWERVGVRAAFREYRLDAAERKRADQREPHTTLSDASAQPRAPRPPPPQWRPTATDFPVHNG